jgi:hypothetical protein
MNHEALVRVLHRRADLQKHAQAIANAQIALLAKPVERRSFHELHDEILEVGCRAVVQQPGYIGVLEFRPESAAPPDPAGPVSPIP